MHIQTATTTTMASPPSPTLTNPDMILPYGLYDVNTPPRQSYSADNDWTPDSVSNMQFSIGSAHSLGSMAPATEIIYGNGTMLSDIGEVTEAESTAGYTRRLPGPAERRMLKQRQNSPLRSSPTLGYDALMKRTKTGTHQRKISMESASTVKSEGRTAELFKDFDDGISVDDSVFQGDDEESVADGYAEEIIASETKRLARTDDLQDGDEDGNSSAALSRRAEQILLNAKKRLNNMEGNLTRARSSLFIHPTNPNSSIHSSSPLSRSTPSPPTNGRLIPLQLGLPPSKRKIHPPTDPPGSPGHSRVYSENSISNQFTSPNLIRSASAAARYGSPKFSPEFAREGTTNGARPGLASATLSRTTTPVNVRLEPLNEDEVSPTFEGDKGSDRSSTEGGFSPGEDHPGLARSTSSMQMRDLKDQMYDLKGRLSVLRDRARDDTMKRRSLQSLRTPSPFTAAEQWYTGGKSYGEGDLRDLSADAGVSYHPYSPKSGEDDGNQRVAEDEIAIAPEYAQSEATSVYEDVSEGLGPTEEREAEMESGERRTISQLKEDLFEEAAVQEDEAIEPDTQEEVYEDEEDYNEEIVNPDEEDDYESDASLYHDAFPTAISHEDREDAFDYEHFFLHSAMGTISQQRHGRRGSYSSEDSVETTRGPSVPLPSDERPTLSHLRSDSNSSVSTFATFATATEGFGSEDEDDEDHDNFAVQQVIIPVHKAATSSPPLTAKRSTFGSPITVIPSEQKPSSSENGSNFTIHPREEINGHGRDRATSSLSTESQKSNGSTRSFPLVNKPKTSYDNINRLSKIASEEGLRSSPVDMLARDDQILVERVVASVGKCVLGLQEAGPTSYEAKVWRRRLDAARRVLEGGDGTA